MGVARPGPQHTKAVWQKDVRHWATLPRCLLRRNGPDVTRPTLQSQWKTGGRPSGTSSPPPPTDPNYHSCISSPLFLHFPSIILFTRTLLDPLCPGWGWDKGPTPMPKTLLFDPELVSSEFSDLFVPPTGKLDQPCSQCAGVGAPAVNLDPGNSGAPSASRRSTPSAFAKVRTPAFA